MKLDATASATVRFMLIGYAGLVVLQRFAVPGLPVALVLPLAFAGAAWGVVHGLVELHRQRLLLWLAVVVLSAVGMIVQAAVLDRQFVSPTSWALFMTVWAPFVLRLVDRRTRTYMAFLAGVTKISVVLAWGCLVMIGSNFAGLAYQDWLAKVVPSPFLIQGFVITYPVEYGSAIYRANAWIGLEPSTVSAQLGVGLVAAFLTGARTRTVVVLLAGLVATTSGSGFAILVGALVVILTSSARHRLRRHAPAAVLALVVGAASPMGATIWERVTNPNIDPSLTLRAIAPYRYLWPMWSDSASSALWGGGPGSSQSLVTRSGIDGLLVTTPIKVFFDYGLVVGGVLAAYMLVACLDGPSRAFAFTIAFSMWTLQPGSTTPIVVFPLLLLVTLWSPRRGDPIEKRFYLARVGRESPLLRDRAVTT